MSQAVRLPAAAPTIPAKPAGLRRLGLAVFAAAAALVFALQGALPSAPAAAEADRDLAAVWALSRTVLRDDAPARLVVRHAAELAAVPAELPALGDRLAAGLGLAAGELSRRADGGAAYTAAAEADGGTVTLRLLPMNERSVFVTVQYEAAEQAALRPARAWQAAAESALRAAGIRPAWSVQVQGELNAALTPDIAAARNDDSLGLGAFWRQLEDGLGAKPVERYTDAATESRSYRAPQFEASVLSGGRPIGFQAAVHRTTEGLWRVTVGTPVLTLEY
ncbi:hypothetical protein J31TS4_31860 [Paenibacillus sp. J31TS4]|uniref:YwmB family TATA-box binding protein n=1 Tax=Paenibacillus sp. J31TS4 TaxID=2807195 RepID=UPI001B27351C|nr:YwmB family TATA-box binding protein [Paenibacillus sp. J31TS4]GIP39906.1 hypothetical protein J31TS4_31860 [Paenibacillus sp. J31TS4]